MTNFEYHDRELHLSARFGLESVIEIEEERGGKTQ